MGWWKETSVACTSNIAHATSAVHWVFVTCKVCWQEIETKFGWFRYGLLVYRWIYPYTCIVDPFLNEWSWNVCLEILVDRLLWFYAFAYWMCNNYFSIQYWKPTIWSYKRFTSISIHHQCSYICFTYSDYSLSFRINRTIDRFYRSHDLDHPEWNVLTLVQFDSMQAIRARSQRTKAAWRGSCTF